MPLGFSSLFFSNRPHAKKVKVGIILAVEMPGKQSLLLFHDLHYFCEGEGKPVCWILDDGGGVGVGSCR